MKGGGFGVIVLAARGKDFHCLTRRYGLHAKLSAEWRHLPFLGKTQIQRHCRHLYISINDLLQHSSNQHHHHQGPCEVSMAGSYPRVRDCPCACLIDIMNDLRCWETLRVALALLLCPCMRSLVADAFRFLLYHMIILMILMVGGDILVGLCCCGIAMSSWRGGTIFERCNAMP
jgi:hypothetical protein